MSSSDAVLLVGAGPMAIEYAKVLRNLGRPMEVVGRGEASAAAFRAATGISAATGGDAALQAVAGRFKTAIVAVGVLELGGVTASLLRLGVGRILVEKPGALSLQEAEEIERLAGPAHAEVYVAYNRRFLSSVAEARRLIGEDGGVTSVRFDFTERSRQVAALPKPVSVKERWFLANSTHVVDLAFHLAGEPAEMVCHVAGSLDWHSAGSQFCGCGVTSRRALFSYSADWAAPGRWSVELCTASRKLFLCPLETLRMQLHGAAEAEAVTLADELDRQNKPGLYREVQCFLSHDTELLCSIAEQSRHMAHYHRIAGYAVAGRG